MVAEVRAVSQHGHDAADAGCRSASCARRAAVNALGHHAGAVVVMDPKSGRVYTVVNQEWALRRGFKPCSTIKLVTGVAGISEKIIQPVETVSVGGNYSLNLTEALAHS